MSFHIGQKVVCVDDHERDGIPSPLARGGVYTITGFFPDGGTGGAGCCLVAEARPPHLYLFFDAVRFKPVEYKAMEIFRRIAANPKINIREVA